MAHWTFGEVAVDRVLEFEQPLLPPHVLFPTSTAEAVESHRHWLEPALMDPASGLLTLSLHSFVVRTRHHTILVDTCSGNDKPRPDKPRYHMKSWPYLENLAAIGVAPEQIDFVMCTHLHADHVGWNTRLVDGRWVPTFANARYLIARAEWDHWKDETKRARYTSDRYPEDSILPVIEAGQVEFVDMDYAFDDQIWLDPTPGHTPGHVCLHIASGGREAVMSGDLMHHPVQCAEPDWSSCFCVDADHSRQTRRAFLEHYAASDVLIMPAHFPTPTAGLIRPWGEAFRFEFDGRGVAAA